MKKRYIIGLDEGTTSARAGVFDTQKNKFIKIVQKPLQLIYPKEGWVEHDANEIFARQSGALIEAITSADIQPEEIFGIGITNQRESVVAWNKTTGKPICNEICWQCRRTAQRIASLTEKQKKIIKEKTGLIPDAYFSASKIQWILENVADAKILLKENNLLVGTIESFLVFKLTKGKVHITDVTNASRTMLCNIKTLNWDKDLLNIFNIPQEILPKIVSCSEKVGSTNILGSSVQICGLAGDQQSALFGQACFEKGMVKNTYGTGCFTLVNTGRDIVSRDKLLTTIAYQIGDTTTYALEGSVFNAGSAVQWIRDELGLIKKSAETERMAFSLVSNGGVYIVPAFTGLGAPVWNSDARGTIVGITRATNKNHIARAVLESMAYASNDIFEEMKKGKIKIDEVRCDGGASDNNFLMQFQSDISQKIIRTPSCKESTLLGSVFLAGLASGAYKDLKEISNKWQEGKTFLPNMDSKLRKSLIKGWNKALDTAIYQSK